MSKYLLSVNTDFAGTKEQSLMDKRNYYIHDFPIKFGMFLRNHRELYKLSTMRRISNTKKGLIMQDLLASTSRIRETYMDELDYLFFNKDKELSDLGVDLLKYSYYDNGLAFGHSNIGILFSTEALSSVKGFTNALRNSNKTIENNPSFAEDYCLQFLLNNIDLIPKMKGGNTFNNDKTELTISEKNLSSVRGGASNRIGFIKLIRTRGHRIYKYLNTNSEGLPVYKRLDNFKYMGDGTSYYDASIKNVEDIDFQSLKERGSSKIDYKKLKEKMNKEMSNEEKEKLEEEKLMQDAKERNEDFATPDETSSINEDAVIEPIDLNNSDEDKMTPPTDKVNEEDEFYVPKDKNVVELHDMKDTKNDVMC